MKVLETGPGGWSYYLSVIVDGEYTESKDVDDLVDSMPGEEVVKREVRWNSLNVPEERDDLVSLIQFVDCIKLYITKFGVTHLRDEEMGIGEPMPIKAAVNKVLRQWSGDSQIDPYVKQAMF